MKYFALLTFLIFASYLLGFIKKPEKYQWMDRNYTTAIKGFSSIGILGCGICIFISCYLVYENYIFRVL